MEADRLAFDEKIELYKKELEESAQSADSQALEEEMQKWKAMYEDLFKKVEPFQVMKPQQFVFHLFNQNGKPTRQLRCYNIEVVW